MAQRGRLARRTGQVVANMIPRAFVHVDGPPGAGKTTLVERLVVGAGGSVLAVRCCRDASLPSAGEHTGAGDPEVRRYRAAGASGAGRFAFGDDRYAADDFLTTSLVGTDVSDVVVVEGDSPLDGVDLRAFVARSPRPGETLLVRRERDRAAEQRAKVDAMEQLLDAPDGAAQLLERMVGGPVVAFAHQRPELLAEMRATMLAGIDKARGAPPPPPTRHWAVADGYAGIEHAQLVVVNVRDDADRERAQGLLEEVRRLRTDRAVFDDVLGWRGSRVPVTAVAADLADPP
jgi:hypothetical protein